MRGLAEWLGWDIALVRLLYLMVSIFSAGFPGILAYIILWIVMPEETGYQHPEKFVIFSSLVPTYPYNPMKNLIFVPRMGLTCCCPCGSQQDVSNYNKKLI